MFINFSASGNPGPLEVDDMNWNPQLFRTLSGVAILLGVMTVTILPVSAAPADAPRIETFASGPVSVTFTLEPPVVHLDRDTLLSIRITAPTNLSVTLPTVDSRLTGFVVAGSYDSPPEIRNESMRQERHVRLTPHLSPEYRIGPVAIIIKSRPSERWFPTRPIVLDAAPIVKGPPGKDISGPRSPVPIRPGLKTIAGYLLGVLVIGALVYGIWWAARHVQRAVKLRRMSPRERALYELAELLARDLVGREQIKDFYFELTMIVRAYIERAHAIRAPEQTTEEFLLAVSRDSRFSPAVVGQLRTFLQAADMVKYAAYRPDQPTVNQALSTARNYIETDAETPIPNNPPSTTVNS
jgi:hypothetical protein